MPRTHRRADVKVLREKLGEVTQFVQFYTRKIEELAIRTHDEAVLQQTSGQFDAPKLLSAVRDGLLGFDSGASTFLIREDLAEQRPLLGEALAAATAQSTRTMHALTADIETWAVSGDEAALDRVISFAVAACELLELALQPFLRVQQQVKAELNARAAVRGRPRPPLKAAQARRDDIIRQVAKELGPKATHREVEAKVRENPDIQAYFNNPSFRFKLTYKIVRRVRGGARPEKKAPKNAQDKRDFPKN